MSSDIEKLCHDLALLETSKKLNDKYAGVSLSKGQIYAFYQENFDPDSFAEIIKNGTAEELP